MADSTFLRRTESIAATDEVKMAIARAQVTLESICTSERQKLECHCPIDEVMGLLLSPSGSLPANLVQALEVCLRNLDDLAAATAAALCLIQGVGCIPNPEFAVKILTPHQDDPRAKALLAECYIFGKGVDKDVFHGVDLLGSARHAGDLYASLVSGDRYRLDATNLGMPDVEKAIEEYRWVLASKDSYHDTHLMKCLAHMRLAQLSEGGVGLDHLREATKFAYPPAQYEFGRMLLSEAETDEGRVAAMAEIECAAEARYLPACLFLARGWSTYTEPANYTSPSTAFPELNLHRAFKYYMYAAEQSHPELQEFAAVYRRQLKTIPAFGSVHQIVEVLSAKAQDQGDTDAQVNLGLCYYFGCGVEQDYSQAFGWHLKAALQGHAYGEFWVGRCYGLGEGVDQDHDQAVEWYQRSANQGNAAAQYNLGLCYEDGQGVAQDYERAVGWYKKAANQSNADAQYSLGACYDDGQGVTQDYEQAVEWYKKAAYQGHAGAQYNLAVCYQNGEGVPQDCKQAFEWCQKAANQDDADAQYKLGAFYHSGDAARQDYKQAFTWFEKSANQDCVDAQSILGNYYYEGRGVTQSYEQAVVWYQKAANQGDAEAQCNLGRCYYHGRGVAENYHNAFELFEESAHQGLASAQYHVGVCYENGQGVAQDYEKAFEWFQNAANQDFALAQYHLAICYEEGQGVIQDYEKAFEWYEKAANQGLAQAQYDLGMCYENGQGVARDHDKAFEWLQKAADEGDEDAEEALGYFLEDELLE